MGTVNFILHRLVPNPHWGQFEPSWLGTYDFIFKLVHRLFEKLTCDAAALFANFVKWHSLKVTDVQDEILGFEVCNVGQ